MPGSRVFPVKGSLFHDDQYSLFPLSEVLILWLMGVAPCRDSSMSDFLYDSLKPYAHNDTHRLAG